MTDKTNFTPEEWKLLLESVMMAGDRRHGRRAQRPLGPSEGELRRRQRRY